MTDKVTLTDLSNLQNENTAIAAINNNNAAITTAINNTLSRDGTSPNQMGAVLDMNGFNILNCPNALSTDPTFNSVTIEPEELTTTAGLTISQSGPNTYTTGAELLYNSITVDNDNVDINGYTSAFRVLQTTGANAGGTKVALWSWINDGASTPGTENQGDHISFSCWASSEGSHGGTNTGAGAKGTLFSVNPFVITGPGATNLFAIAGGEVDIIAGAESRYKWGWSVVDASSGVHAAELDAGYSIGATGGGSGWEIGLVFTSIHGGAPVITTGTLIGTDGTSATVDHGIDFSAYTFSSDSIKMPGFAVDGSGFVTAASGTAIPAGGTAGAGYKLSSTSNFGVFFGSSAPTLAAAKGSLYLRSDGTGTGDRAYINTNGTTGWTAITTAT